MCRSRAVEQFCWYAYQHQKPLSENAVKLILKNLSRLALWLTNHWKTQLSEIIRVYLSLAKIKFRKTHNLITFLKNRVISLKCTLRATVQTWLTLRQCHKILEAINHEWISTIWKFLKELIAAYRTKYAVQFNKNFPVEGKMPFQCKSLNSSLLKHWLGLHLTNFKEA